MIFSEVNDRSKSNMSIVPNGEKLVKLGYENIIEFGGIIDWKGDFDYSG